MKRYKYPRTAHMSGSRGSTSDDIHISGYSSFEGKEVIITEKMDGESFTFYADGYFHARSIDGRVHPSRTHTINALFKLIGLIPDGVRICGENLYAAHSIKYTSLPSYFQVYSAWEGETCWDWDRTIALCNDLSLHTVPVLYRGVFSEQELRKVISSLDFNSQEGVVMRSVDQFTMDQFNDNVCKYVRPNHVQTDQHWMSKQIVKNGLAAQ